VEKHYQKFPVHVAPLRDTIYWVVIQFEQIGMWDKHEKGCKHNVPVRMEEVVSVAREEMAITSRKRV
jgi:hypothetical protein